jgi:hypothetical protein
MFYTTAHYTACARACQIYVWPSNHVFCANQICDLLSMVAWNEYFLGSLLIHNSELRTIPLGWSALS